MLKYNQFKATARGRLAEMAPSRMAGLAACTLIAALALTDVAGAQSSTSIRRHMIVGTGHTFSFAGNFLAARYARRSKDISRAADYYRRALDADPENLFLLERTFSLMVADGQFEEGTELADRLIERKSRNRLAPLTIALNALQNGNNDRTIDILSATPREPLERLTNRLILAWALQAKGRTDEALKTIDDISGMDWYAVYKAYHSGLIAGLAGREQLAVDHLASAHKADSGAMRVVTAYVRALARVGEADQARATLANFKGARGTHPLLAPLTKNLEAGEKPAPLITDPLAGAAEVLYGLGTAISRDGGEEISAIYLQLSLYLNPEADLPKIVLSGLFEKLRHYDRSITILERIGGHSPLFRSARIQMAINSTAYGSIGPTAGCSCVLATRSRSSV
jgi:tetratricopeptide (TPR) repeat protein